MTQLRVGLSGHVLYGAAARHVIARQRLHALTCAGSLQWRIWVPRVDMDQYCILGRIGEGAHGIVFKAKHVEVRSRRTRCPRGTRCLLSASGRELRPFGAETCQRAGLRGLWRLVPVPSGAIPLPAAGLRDRVP